MKENGELCSPGEESSAGPLEVSPGLAAGWLPAALPARQSWSCPLCHSEGSSGWCCLSRHAVLCCLKLDCVAVLGSGQQNLFRGHYLHKALVCEQGTASLCCAVWAGGASG